MSARERERGELPSPDWSLFDRKVGQGLLVFSGIALDGWKSANCAVWKPVSTVAKLLHGPRPSVKLLGQGRHLSLNRGAVRVIAVTGEEVLQHLNRLGLALQCGKLVRQPQ